MVQDTIETMLRQKLGLDANSVGSRLIERAVEQRQIACRLPDRSDYLTLLRSSPQEFNQLIEAIVVPETWFFRDREPFEYLRHYVKAYYLNDDLKDGLNDGFKNDFADQSEGGKNRSIPLNSIASEIAPQFSENEILRILSIPCSTGEEPYSIAIALLETGLTTAQFQIDAVDISQQALLKARQGIYHKKSFRGGAIQNLEHYFQPKAEGYEVRSIVRESVNFAQGNAIEPNFLLGKQYHMIFCRNLLIYLDDTARDQVMASLDRALSPLGLLFLGSAETAQLRNKPYRAIDHAFAFAYQKELDRKELPAAPQTLPEPAARQTARPAAANPLQAVNSNIVPAAAISLKRKESGKTALSKIRVSSPPAPRLADVPVPPLFPLPSPFPAPLETAKQLADRGQLLQAAQLCESYIRAHPAQSIAYLLLGEIYQGLNQSKRAEQCFQRAIYLNPNAYEALIHLALLKEQQGNRAESERLRMRAQRLADQHD